MGDPNFFIQRNKTSVFIVKNIVPTKKTISIFNYPIAYGEERDLFSIPGISEDDIRLSLLKGDLLKKLKIDEITLVSTNINLLYFDLEFRNFLKSKGILVVDNISVDTLADLTSFPTSNLEDGIKIYVNTLQEDFILDKTSTATNIDFIVLDALNGGKWIRKGSPSLNWINYDSWYIDPITGNNENSGIEQTAPLKDLEEFKRRIIPNIKYKTSLITCFILSDIVDNFAFEATFNTFGFNIPAIQFDGSLGTTVLLEDTVSSITVAVPGSNTSYKLTSNDTTNWTPYIGKIALVSSSDAVDARFVILADNGDGSAHISQIGAGIFDATQTTLAPGDSFKILHFPQLGGLVSIEGHCGLNFYQLSLGAQNIHKFTVFQSLVFVDMCILYDCDIHSNGNLVASNCFISGIPRAYDSSVLTLWGGGADGSPIVHNGGTIYFTDFTLFGSLRAGDGGGFYIIDSGWLAFYNMTTAITISNIQALVCQNGGQIFGTGIAGPKINILPNGKFFYQSGLLPNLTGTGTDVSVGGTAKTFAQIPFANITNLAMIMTST